MQTSLAATYSVPASTLKYFLNPQFLNHFPGHNKENENPILSSLLPDYSLRRRIDPKCL